MKESNPKTVIHLNQRLNQYRLIEELYLGKRTLVYRGVVENQTQESSPVVLKWLREEYPTFNDLLQFRNQYAIAKNLDLEGIIRPYSLETYRNSYLLVMEDFGGVSLRNHIKTNKLSLLELLKIATQLATILQEIHRNSVIHKDIKPANILIHPATKQVKIIDFSIASLLPRETQEIQNPNQLEGTLAYISPEQTGRMNRGIDYRSDFYALGITLYELLTGELPFKSNDPMELVHSHLAQAVPSIQAIDPTIPLILTKIINKLIAKNAEERYQSAFGIKQDLAKCLKQLQETAKIANFPIAKQDICDRFLLSEKLYGREKEVEKLLAAFARVSLGVTEIILVAGFSGIGKTAVVNEVHKPIVRQRGYFVKGKFDQFKRNIPFSAFVQAFRDLMKQLLTESDAQIQQWKSKILAAIGENGQTIVDVIPELEKIIGKQPPVVDLSGTAVQNRFNLLLQKFTQVFTNKEHPLVMFLDDLQWADTASLKLIQVLMADTSYLLLIGAYRDNEVNPTHPLMLTLSEIAKADFTINTITLNPLNQSYINQLVADTLKSTIEVALPLSKLVFQKTKGNPFFTNQFLKALHEEKLIQFNLDENCWQCNVTQIKEQVLSEDVVEFMALQLEKLPLATQEVLKLAACIGNQFDLATLAIVSEKSAIDAAVDLWKALQEELILPVGEVYKFYVGEKTLVEPVTNSQTVSYKFLHDRVQQAAYSLIPDQRKQRTHYHIGQLLLEKIPPETRAERIFELVNQLNYGITLIQEQHQKEELAKLNLNACQKAKAATAYQAAQEYATVGLQLLGVDAWQKQYEITLSLHNLGAEVAFLAGDFEQMDRWIEAVIAEGKTALERVQVYQVRIQALVARNQFLEAIAIGQSVFQMLGVNLPNEPSIEDIRPIKQEIDELIGDRPIESFLNLPPMSDRQQLAIMQNAARLTPVCYMSGATMLYFLVVALQVKLSIQFGNSSVAAFCYVGYAFQLRMLWGEMTMVSQFGQLGYQLALEPDSKNIRAATAILMGAYVGCWTIHLQETLPILLDGYQTGLETGNLEFMVYDAQLYCFNAYWLGQPLIELEPQMEAYYQQLYDLNQLTTANCVLVYWQATQILLGKSENDVPLRQDFYEAEVLEEAKVDFYRLCFFYLYRFTLNYWLEDFAKAEHDAAQTRQYLAGGMGSIAEPVFYFYDSLTVLATSSESITESEPRWQRILENQVKLKEWADYGSMNYLHKYHLVEAEKYRVLDSKVKAIELYDLAIAGAKENNFLQEEALANELAAKFYLNWEKEKVAAGYLQEAYYCYARWGAKAKVEDLEKRYPQLLSAILQQTRSTLSTDETIFSSATLTSSNSWTSSNSASVSLDLATILEVSQTLSCEIELDKLLSSLLTSVIENAGAERGVLMLIEDERLVIKGSMTIGKKSLVLQEIPVEESQNIPRKIIYQVKHSLQTKVLSNPSAEPSLAHDPYLQQQQPKSILCSPILHQGKLMGILYLENNLTTRAFTRDRVELLKLVSIQAAISLENARLYANLQKDAQQLEQVLHNLQKTQLQLIQGEKMSALGNLVAGVAHEMNNPLGFISASLQQAKPTVNDLIEHLRFYQETFPNSSEEILDHADKIDLDYILEDLPKILDSLVMACDRLRNISTSLRTFSRADKEYKVRFNIHEGIESTLLILKHRLRANQQRPVIEVVTNYGNFPEVECFPGQLNQVFMNLIANAIDTFDEVSKGQNFAEIKANPNRITITTSVENQTVKITIADNGKGMSEEIKQRIFDHLFTTKAVGKGTGLGLAIASQIITEKHSGTITCNSELGKGAKFIIEIPLQR
ncbi:MAG: AAA family ATPase [Oscillatoria sp. PMC 1076.18]|nr:AAA family ATPase [Oscillatoria sp. PMC 1076.18]